MDWKILGASMVAILLIGGLLATQEKSGFFYSLFGGMRDLLNKSPFEGFFAAPSQGPKEVSLFISAPHLELHPKSPVNITSSTASVTGFSGWLNISFDDKQIGLESTQFAAKLPLDEWHVAGLHLATASFSDVSFDIKSRMGSEGSIDIKDFLGNATITPEGLLLEGNVSKLNVHMDDLEWELK